LLSTKILGLCPTAQDDATPAERPEIVSMKLLLSEGVNEYDFERILDIAPMTREDTPSEPERYGLDTTDEVNAFVQFRKAPADICVESTKMLESEVARETKTSLVTS